MSLEATLATLNLPDIEEIRDETRERVVQVLVHHGNEAHPRTAPVVKGLMEAYMNLAVIAADANDEEVEFDVISGADAEMALHHAWIDGFCTVDGCCKQAAEENYYFFDLKWDDIAGPKDLFEEAGRVLGGVDAQNLKASVAKLKRLCP